VDIIEIATSCQGKSWMEADISA